MTDIFISYSRKDKPWVEKLATALEAEGYDVWWDPEILPGQDYESVIRGVLETAKCVITVWSKESINSHWVKAESNRGLDRGILVPVLYQAVSPPMPFDRIQSADLQNWKGKTDDPRYQQLLRAIAIHCPPSDDMKQRPPLPKKKTHWLGIVAALALLGGAGTIALNYPFNGNSESNQQEQVDQEAEVQKLAEEQAKTEEAKAEQERLKQKREAERAEKEKLAKEAAKIAAKQKAKEEPARKKQAELAAAKAKQASMGHYVDNGDGTVTDTKTKLMWKKCSEGQSGADCSQGSAKGYKWDVAMKQFKQVSFAGHNDWRIPAREELLSLVYCSNGVSQKEAQEKSCSGKNNDQGKYSSPTINQTAFPNSGRYYWSSTERDARYAWLVNFSDGNDGWGFRYYDDLVRLVRSDQ